MNFVILASIFGLAEAHNWMTAPVSRNGNQAATTIPCDVGTSPSIPTMIVEMDQPFSISWTTNHDGNHFVKIASLSQELQLESMTTTSTPALVHYGSFPVSTASTSFTFTSGSYLEGMYVLQYGWSNYRNCATIQVVPSGSGSSGVNVTGGVDEINCVSYCEDYAFYCNSLPNYEFSYTDTFDCLAKCATFPLGDPSDVLGNTLHCRNHHLHIEGGLPAEHCPHASLNGTNKCFRIPGGEDFLPAIALTLASTNNQADILSQFRTAFASEGGIVTVTEAEVAGEFIVTIQFPDSESELVANYLSNPELVTEKIDGTSINVVSMSIIGADYAFDYVLNSVNTNGVIVAVMVPLVAFLLTGATIANKSLISEKLTSLWPADPETLLKLTAFFNLISFIVIGVVCYSSVWAVANTSVLVTFNLWKFCIDGDCSPLTGFDLTEKAEVQAAQGFLLLNWFVTAITATFIYFNQLVGMPWQQMIKAQKWLDRLLISTCLQCLFVFFGMCFSAAFFSDVIVRAFPDATLGWPMDLLGLYWVGFFTSI
jgi:hypothetical protein